MSTKCGHYVIDLANLGVAFPEKPNLSIFSSIQTLSNALDIGEGYNYSGHPIAIRISPVGL